MSSTLFKLHNPLVVIDLEATAGLDERGFQTNNCIIDLGAVFLNEKLESVSTFSSLVKPEEVITPFIEDLTGISPAMVENEKSFEIVGQQFLDWISSFCNNIKKVRLAAWGNYFDIPLLRKNYEKNGCEFPFSGTALDVKTLAFFWLSHSGQRTDKLQIENLAQYFGIKPQGRYHRALTDAQVTAEILVKIWHEMAGFFIPIKEGEPYRRLSVHWD